MKTSTYLRNGWTLRAVAGPIPSHLQNVTVPATVPGSVHTDLLTAGAIVDPYLDENEAALRWTHDVTWRYERTLHAAPADTDERVEVVFEGLDTIAAITLDGVDLGHTVNMHRSYR
ncbi:MAG: glycoside hydrolase family 2 protein, partial [Arachnia sp.]